MENENNNDGRTSGGLRVWEVRNAFAIPWRTLTKLCRSTLNHHPRRYASVYIHRRGMMRSQWKYVILYSLYFIYSRFISPIRTEPRRRGRSVMKMIMHHHWCIFAGNWKYHPRWCTRSVFFESNKSIDYLFEKTVVLKEIIFRRGK